jgi:hypothetical protein
VHTHAAAAVINFVTDNEEYDDEDDEEEEGDTSGQYQSPVGRAFEPYAELILTQVRGRPQP